MFLLQEADPDSVPVKPKRAPRKRKPKASDGDEAAELLAGSVQALAASAEASTAEDAAKDAPVRRRRPKVDPDAFSKFPACDLLMSAGMSLVSMQFHMNS